MLVYNGPASPFSNQVPGTLSQVFQCFDTDGVLVLVVHRFLRPDGTATEFDPKLIFREGTIYYSKGLMGYHDLDCKRRAEDCVEFVP